MKVNLTISGLQCANCAARLQKALSATQGVICANVDFSSKQAAVEFNEEVVSLGALGLVVSNCGFTVANP